jgi:hypothetical protein
MTTPKSRAQAALQAEPDPAEPQGLLAQRVLPALAAVLVRAALGQVVLRVPQGLRVPEVQRVLPAQRVLPVRRVQQARAVRILRPMPALMLPTRRVTPPRRRTRAARSLARAGALSSTRLVTTMTRSTLDAPASAAIRFAEGQFHVAATICE